MSMLVLLLLLILLLLAVVMNYYSEITLTTPFRVVDGVECPLRIHSTSLLWENHNVLCKKNV